MLNPFLRWGLAIVAAIVLILVIAGFAVFGIMAMAFGSAGCKAIGEEPSLFFLLVSPIVMGLGVIVSAVLFGLNKRWFWWLGALFGGGFLGVMGYVLWFLLVANVWCVS